MTLYTKPPQTFFTCIYLNRPWSTAGRLSIILHHAKWLHAHFLKLSGLASTHSLWMYESYMKVYGFSNELKNMLPQELNCINCNQTMCIVENPYFATAFLCAATACFTPGCNSADHCKSSLSVMLRLNYQHFENVKKLSIIIIISSFFLCVIASSTWLFNFTERRCPVVSLLFEKR